MRGGCTHTQGVARNICTFIRKAQSEHFPTVPCPGTARGRGGAGMEAISTQGYRENRQLVPRRKDRTGRKTGDGAEGRQWLLFCLWSFPESTHFLLSGIFGFVKSPMVRYSVLKPHRSPRLRTAKGVEGSHGCLRWMEFMSHYWLTKDSPICADWVKRGSLKRADMGWCLVMGFLCKLSWRPESSARPQLPSAEVIPQCSKAGWGRLAVPMFESSLKAIHPWLLCQGHHPLYDNPVGQDFQPTSKTVWWSQHNLSGPLSGLQYLLYI